MLAGALTRTQSGWFSPAATLTPPLNGGKGSGQLPVSPVSSEAISTFTYPTRRTSTASTDSDAPDSERSSPAVAVRPARAFSGRTTSWELSASLPATLMRIAWLFAVGSGRVWETFHPEDAHQRPTSGDGEFSNSP